MANKPVLFYGIEALVDAGVTEIGIVIAPETGDEIREAAGDGERFGASITYITQDGPRGTGTRRAHRRGLPRPGRPSSCTSATTCWPRASADSSTAFRETGPDALILLTPVDDPSSYGVAELDGERVVRLVEKPKDPPSDLALVGVYLFGPSIFEAARGLEPSWRGELEITEAIDRLIEGGERVESQIVTGWWKDTGQLADMLEANRLVLEELEHAHRRRRLRSTPGSRDGSSSRRARRSAAPWCAGRR